MRVWSRGLGRVELGFDLRKVKVEYVDNQMILSGKTEPPASWDFVIKLDVSETFLLGKVAASRSGVSLFSHYLKYKTLNRRMLRERMTEATKTKTGVQPQLRPSQVKPAALAK